MHELYLATCVEQNLPEIYKIKKCTYNKVFVTEFNLSFGYPKSDTCATCDAGNSNEEHVLTLIFPVIHFWNSNIDIFFKI